MRGGKRAGSNRVRHSLRDRRFGLPGAAVVLGEAEQSVPDEPMVRLFRDLARSPVAASRKEASRHPCKPATFASGQVCKPGHLHAARASRRLTPPQGSQPRRSTPKNSIERRWHDRQRLRTPCRPVRVSTPGAEARASSRCHMPHGSLSEGFKPAFANPPPKKIGSGRHRFQPSGSQHDEPPKGSTPEPASQQRCHTDHCAANHQGPKPPAPRRGPSTNRAAPSMADDERTAARAVPHR